MVAGHQQQHLVEPVHDPLRLTTVRKLGKVLRQQGQTRTRNLLAGKPKCQTIHRSAPNRITAPSESHPHVNAKWPENPR
jgi:hypothetical protein